MSPRPLALLALLVLPCGVRAGVRPAHGGTIRIALPAPPLSGSCADRAAELLVSRALSAPLLELDERGELQPGVLDEVPRPEAGGRAFRLRVRPGLRDASGRSLGAADVAARLVALLRDPPPARDAWVALPILGADAFVEGRAALLAGVQVLSPYELLVTLAFPLPEFPHLLASAPAALPGAGPFLSAGRRSPAEPLLLVGNDHHHRGRPFADSIELSAPDARSAARLLEHGDLDLVLRPEAAGGRQGPSLVPLTVTVAALNAARLGPGARTIRDTLSGLDRTELSRRFVRGPSQALRSLVPSALLPGAPASGTPEDEPAPPAPPRLAILADASGPDQRALAERLQVKLFDAGSRATVELLEPERFRARLLAGDYDVALVSVPLLAFRPALAVAQIVYAVRGAGAARRALAELAGLDAGAALEATARVARELDLVPLVASGVRASLGPALQGFAPAPDGSFDPGDLWRLGGAAP